MCESCQDLNRTVLLLGDLCLYAERPDVDQEFADLVGGALAVSLPPDVVPPLYEPPPESGW
ncbi:hypothetical protein [Streptomyces fractus]|uniref:hypothetical protein n=1 Tax=Streptomyces fractus TaxID=641806 RepID=UPI003CF1D9ED